MCVRDAFEAALEQRARHLQAIQVHERKATDEFRGLREEIDRLLPDDRYWKWRSGIGKDDDAVLLFDADALTEDPNSKDLHLDFLDMMMVCEDIAVVIKNTIDLDRSLWSAKSILDQLSQRDYRHHKCFKYKYDESCEPTGFKYRKQRGVVQDVDIAEISKQFDKKDWRSGDTFYFVKDLYLSDHLRSLATDFEVGFKLKEVLPGGSNCGMNNNPARPSVFGVGYLSPGGGETFFHMDADGMMDAGHYCVQGYNHVIMFRPLSRKHTAELKRNGIICFEDDVSNNGDGFWMDESAFRYCKAKGYKPIRFILEPGEFLHIPKGRLHAFRKGMHQHLPRTDCHYQLHESLLERLRGDSTGAALSHASHFNALSVTWDWMHLGRYYQTVGRNMEIALHHSDQKLQSRRCHVKTNAILLAVHHAHIAVAAIKNHALDHLSVQICGGLFKLIDLVDREMGENFALEIEWGKSEAFSLDTSNPAQDATPDARGTLSCLLCRADLFNTYFLCVGCDNEENSDFIVCPACLMQASQQAFTIERDHTDYGKALNPDKRMAHNPENEAHRSWRVCHRLYSVESYRTKFKVVVENCRLAHKKCLEASKGMEEAAS